MKKCASIFLVSIACSLSTTAQHTDTLEVKVHDHVMTLYASGAGIFLSNVSRWSRCVHNHSKEFPQDVYFFQHRLLQGTLRT